MIRPQRGFSLFGVLLALAISGWLLGQGWTQWAGILRRAHMAEARLVLQQNARFIERWLLEHADSLSAGQAWPALPRPSTAHYLIRFGAVHVSLQGRYRLLAVPRVGEQESGQWFLRMDQNGYIAECQWMNRREKCQHECQEGSD